MSMVRTAERGSLIIVILALIGLGFWVGSRDSHVDRALEEQGRDLEDARSRLEQQEQENDAQGVSIESNRVAIEENRTALGTLRTEVAERAREIDSLRESARTLTERLSGAEAGLEEMTALGSQLREVKDRLAGLEREALEDAQRIVLLESRLESLDSERAEELRRIERIERALGID